MFTITLNHFYGNKHVSKIIISKKELTNKDIKKLILECLQKKKDSHVEYKNYRFELENQYIYPNNEIMGKYFESPEFKTGKKILVITNLNPIIPIENSEYCRLIAKIEKNKWLNEDQFPGSKVYYRDILNYGA